MENDDYKLNDTREFAAVLAATPDFSDRELGAMGGEAQTAKQQLDGVLTLARSLGNVTLLEQLEQEIGRLNRRIWDIDAERLRRAGPQ